ncbi:hypothetical protein FK531_09945 [Rhodococcus spelaei]|uniref:Uncharacterized protein n=1 Tax=Rhodococcus spelaei TaxID=2546320 RepID=A0A541B9S7_9NOCA|nr:hypothetical protein [Rhodococcus spelaei]TQF69086.1 hypothetical protein FK531_09945 [Rhodococcus spelaei]
MKAQTTTRIALAGMGILAGSVLAAPAVAGAEPIAPTFKVVENSPALTVEVTGSDAKVVVTAPADANVFCMSPFVVKGSLDAKALQKSLDDYAKGPQASPLTATGVAAGDYSAMVYPKVTTSADPAVTPTFEPTITFVSNVADAAKSATASLTGLADGPYGALTNCIDQSGSSSTFYVRNFQIGKGGDNGTGSAGSSDNGSSSGSGGNGSSFGSTLGTAGSLENLLGSS